MTTSEVAPKAPRYPVLCLLSGCVLVMVAVAMGVYWTMDEFTWGALLILIPAIPGAGILIQTWEAAKKVPSASIPSLMLAAGLAALLGFATEVSAYVIKEIDINLAKLSVSLRAASVVPWAAVILVAFSWLGELIKSKSLEVSAVCAYLSLVGLTFLALTEEPMISRFLVVVCYILCGVLLLASFGLLTEKYKEKETLLGTILVLITLGCFLLFGSFGWPVANRWVVLIGLLLVLSAFVYPAWFGIALIRNREALGKLASILGVAYLLNVLATIGVLVWFILTLIAETQAAQLDPTFETKVNSLFDRMELFELVATGVLALLTAGFFFTAKHPEPLPDPEPSPELKEDEEEQSPAQSSQ